MKTNKHFKRIVLLIAIAALTAVVSVTLVSCSLLSGLGGGTTGGDDGNESSNVTYNNIDITVNDGAMALRYATAEVIDSVVTVQAVFKYGTRTATLSGSGTIITSDGYIMTNRHVVTYSPYILQSITVTTIDADYNEKTYKAELVSCSGTFDLDIRLLKITDAGDKVFKPVSIAKSSTLKMGDTAFMIGNSASTGFTMSSAVVAHPKSTEFADQGLGLTEIIKLNADVNHGNSGGGLFNLKGDLVGVVTYRKEGNTSSPNDMIQGIGYAIRTEDIMPIIRAHYGETIYNKIAQDTYDDIVEKAA